MKVTWDEIHKDSLDLAHLLLPLGPFDAVLGIARGGLVPATIIAHAMKIRLVSSISAASYDDERRKASNVTLLLPTHEKFAGAKTLIVDDLVDTGDTASAVRARLPNALYAVLYAKPKGSPHAHVALRQVPQDTWIEFPWE